MGRPNGRTGTRLISISELWPAIRKRVLHICVLHQVCNTCPLSHYWLITASADRNKSCSTYNLHPSCVSTHHHWAGTNTLQYWVQQYICRSLTCNLKQAAEVRRDIWNRFCKRAANTRRLCTWGPLGVATAPRASPLSKPRFSERTAPTAYPRFLFPNLATNTYICVAVYQVEIAPALKISSFQPACPDRASCTPHFRLSHRHHASVSTY